MAIDDLAGKVGQGRRWAASPLSDDELDFQFNELQSLCNTEILTF
jgi:hypothetical protein